MAISKLDFYKFYVWFNSLYIGYSEKGERADFFPKNEVYLI